MDFADVSLKVQGMTGCISKDFLKKIAGHENPGYNKEVAKHLIIYKH